MKKARLTEEIVAEICREGTSMQISAWAVVKKLKRHFNEGDEIRNKAAAISILLSEFEDQLKSVLEDHMKWQD